MVLDKLLESREIDIIFLLIAFQITYCVLFAENLSLFHVSWVIGFE